MKKLIQQRINALHYTLLGIEAEMRKSDNFNSYNQSSIDNLKHELQGNETALNESSEDPTELINIKSNFKKSLDDLSDRIYGLQKAIPSNQISREFHNFLETNFNFIKPTLAQIPFGTTITSKPENIPHKILKMWKVKNVDELNELMDLIKDKFIDYQPLDTYELKDIAPLFFIIYNN
jgi:hypothetical protein